MKTLFVPFKYSDIKVEATGTTIIFITEKNSYKSIWGYINEKGHLKCYSKFVKAEPFKNGFARVQIEKRKWFFIDTSMNILPSGPFKDAHDFSDGAALVKVNNKWGYIDQTGKFLIKPQYSKAGDFSEGIAPVFRSLNGTSISNRKNSMAYVFINKNNKIEINQSFDYCSNFVSGAAVIRSKNKYGLINTKGKKIISAKYTRIISYPEYGLFKIKKNKKKYAICNSQGVNIIPFKKNLKFCEFGDGLCAVKSGLKYNYIDTLGNIIFSIRK